MSIKDYFVWFKENWPKTGLIVAIFLTIYLILLVLPKSTVLFAILMSTPLYMIHEFDEYVFPGRFAQFMNHNIYKMDPDKGLVDQKAVLIINMIVWIALPIYSLWAITDLTQGAWMPYFFIFQAVVHLILGIVGKRFVNPGITSAWLIHVPWGIWTIWLLEKAGVIVNPFWNPFLVDGLEVNIYLLLAGALLLIRYKLKHKS
jgi:hypothetical protein